MDERLEFQHLSGGTAGREGAHSTSSSSVSASIPGTHGQGTLNTQITPMGLTLTLITRQEFWSKPKQRMMPNPPVQNAPGSQPCDHVSLQWMSPVINTSHSLQLSKHSSHSAARVWDWDACSSCIPFSGQVAGPQMRLQDSPEVWSCARCQLQFPALLLIPPLLDR